MKKFILNVIILIIVQKIYAQSNLVVEYNETNGITSFENQRKTDGFNRKEYLYINGDSVAFFSYGLQKPIKSRSIIGSKKDHHSLFVFPKFKRALHENHWVRPYNLKEYTLPDYEWNFHSDTMLIAGYVCSLAVADSIVAWYTKDIKIPFGPVNFYGLPGLILMLEDHRSMRLYKALSVSQHNNKIVLPDIPLKSCNDCESKLVNIKAQFNL